MDLPDEDAVSKIHTKKPKVKKGLEDAVPHEEVKREAEEGEAHPDRKHTMALKLSHGDGAALKKKQVSTVKTAEESGISLERQLNKEKKAASITKEKKSAAKPSIARKTRARSTELPTPDTSSNEDIDDPKVPKSKTKTAAKKAKGRPKKTASITFKNPNPETTSDEEESAVEENKASAKIMAKNGKGRATRKTKKIVEESSEESASAAESSDAESGDDSDVSEDMESK